MLHANFDTSFEILYDTIEYFKDSNEQPTLIESLIMQLQSDFYTCYADSIDSQIFTHLWDFLECAYQWAIEGDLNASLYALNDFEAGLLSL